MYDHNGRMQFCSGNTVYSFRAGSIFDNYFGYLHSGSNPFLERIFTTDCLDGVKNYFN